MTITAERKERAKAFQDHLLAVMQEELGKRDLPKEDMLAALAYLVGRVIAMQDQRKMTAAQAIQLVQDNIELGNADQIAALEKTQGRA